MDWIFGRYTAMFFIAQLALNLTSCSFQMVLPFFIKIPKSSMNLSKKIPLFINNMSKMILEKVIIAHSDSGL